jgi:hypothetical protein
VSDFSNFHPASSFESTPDREGRKDEDREPCDSDVHLSSRHSPVSPYLEAPILVCHGLQLIFSTRIPSRSYNRFPPLLCDPPFTSPRKPLTAGSNGQGILRSYQGKQGITCFPECQQPSTRFLRREGMSEFLSISTLPPEHDVYLIWSCDSLVCGDRSLQLGRFAIDI